MRAATKVMFNTVVLYAKILATMSIALVSVPLVLKALGASDYGLYNLVAGLVTMLSFLNNSMIVSTQRYMSVAMGEGKSERINAIYSSSFLLHLGLAVLVCAALEVMGLASVERLNVPEGRMWCAEWVFQLLVLCTFSRIVSVPFDALMNAHEDMLAFSVIELVDSFLMLVVAVSLRFVPVDRLAFYGFCVAGIALSALLMKWAWCRWAYRSCRVSLAGGWRAGLVGEMLGFSSWNLFGGLALMGRNQGVAVLFNLFLGTLANAAYGVANQINNAMVQFSSTFQRAINPQLMKSEGMGNKARLLRISLISSKFSTLAIALFAVPLIVEMDDVLGVWLGQDTPPFTPQLARWVLLLSIVSQLSAGLMSAIQATGVIRDYQITMGLLILLNVPAAYAMLRAGLPVYCVTMGFVAVEAVSLAVRVFMARRIVGLSPRRFAVEVVSPCACVLGAALVLCLVPYCLVEGMWARLALTCGVYGSAFLAAAWFVAVDAGQRSAVTVRLRGLMGRITR